jgi:hypothetical protein
MVPPLPISHCKGKLGQVSKSAQYSPYLCSQCLDLEWDYDGETLAIVQDGSSIVIFWETASRKVTQLETNWKGLVFCRWSMDSETVIKCTYPDLYTFVHPSGYMERTINYPIQVPVNILHLYLVVCWEQ